jgi:WD40 repeat protein
VVAAQRAEASKLLVLAQLKLQEDPTEALAYTTASLELADTREARLMALRALQEAPPAWELSSEIGNNMAPAFSPDGHHLAVPGFTSEVGVWRDDGSPPLRLPGHETSASGGGNWAAWASSEMLVTGLWGGNSQQVHVWSVPGGQKLRTINFGTPSWWQVGPGRLLAETPENPAEPKGALLLRSWPLPDGEPEVLGHVDRRRLGITSSFFEPHGRAWLYTKGTTIHTVPLPVDLGADRVFSRHGASIGLSQLLAPDLLALRDKSGENRLLRFPENGPPVTTVVPKPGSAPVEAFATSSPRWIRGLPVTEARLRLWDTTALPGAQPLELRREGSWVLAGFALDPAGRTAVISTHGISRLTFWPLPARWPSVVDGYKWGGCPFAFSPDSRWLATVKADRQLRLWPLPGTGSSEVRMLGVPPDLPRDAIWWDMAFDPRGRYLIVATYPGDNTWIVPLDGSPFRRLSEDSSDTRLCFFAFSPTGRYVARAADYGRGPKTLRVWDVEAGVLHVFDSPVPQPPPGSTPRPPTGFEGAINSLAFVDDSTLYTAGDGGVRRWNLETGAQVLVKDSGPGAATSMTMSDDRRVAFTQRWPLDGTDDPCAPLERLDMATGVSTPLPRFGDCTELPDTAGPLLASKSRDGILVLRAARVSASEAHLFTVPGKFAGALLAISPDLKWVASTSDDNTLRLWPMPDLDQPPLHTLPRDELVAKLKSLTNLRAVRDAKSATGWSIELGPFPGWRNIPAW